MDNYVDSPITVNILGFDQKLYTKKTIIFVYDEENIRIKNKKLKKGGFDEFTFEDDGNDLFDKIDSFDNFDKIDSFDNFDKIENSDNRTLKKQNLNQTTELSIEYITDIHVYPHDTIWEFREKLALATNIMPLYQHLFAKQFLPYKVLTDDGEIDINLYDIENEEQKLQNIPIMFGFYEKKLQIIANDSFELMSDNSNKNITEYYLIDIHEFFKENQLQYFKNASSYEKQLVYSSFILPYFPIINMEIFINWLNKVELHKIYPDLFPDLEKLKRKYDIEKKIVLEADILNLKENTKYLKEIEKLRLSLTSSTINTFAMGNTKTININLRNLFDQTELNEEIDYCKVCMYKDKDVIILEKFYDKNPMNTEPQIFHPAYHRSIINSIIYRIRLNPKSEDSIYVLIFQNGNYMTRANWSSEQNLGFDDIFNLCKTYTNILIQKLNKLNSINIPLVIMNEKNSKFAEMNLNIYWKGMTELQFRAFKDILSYLQEGNVLYSRMIDHSYAEYYFKKGMHQFDVNRIIKTYHTDNYYDYLINGQLKTKWFNLFVYTRILKITNRSELQMEILGIKEKEYDVFIHYLYIALFLYLKKEIKGELREVGSSDNKHLDPELYSTKLSSTKYIYSRICQKIHQPVMHNEEEYNLLTDDEKKSTIKYWNFTRKTPVYYRCPNKKFPYPRFITNKHPKKYCIPCCKITPVSEQEDIKALIHKTCLDDKQWVKPKKALTESSRYIMSYGKNIEEGRLSRLPEQSLEPLFYDLINLGPIDQECTQNRKNGYYLLGVNQSVGVFQKGGLINCIAVSLDYNINTFLEECDKRIKNDNKYKLLLNGKIEQYFPQFKDFKYQIQNIGNDENSNKINYWHCLFKDIAFLYFNINIIIFEENKNINLIVPGYLTNINDFIPDHYMNLFVLQKKKDKIYYPIFLFNQELFFRTKIVNQKLFESNSEICLLLMKIAKKQLKKSENLDLDAIKKFSNSSDWKLNKILVNKSNLCYAVILNKGKKQICLPISQSYYTNEDYQTDLLSRKQHGQLSHINECIIELNKWIKKISLNNSNFELLYNILSIDYWLLLDKQIIGFNYRNLNYYFSPAIAPIQAKKLYEKPIKDILYDPDLINTALNLNQSSYQSLNKKLQFNNSLFEYHKYQIFLMHCISYMKNQKNLPLRNKIYKMIMFNKINDVNNLLNFRDKKIFASLISNINEKCKQSDIITRVKNINFDFDIILKNMGNFNDTLKHVRQITQKIVKIGVRNIKNFANNIELCPDGSCSDNKLILTKKEFEELTEILTQDLMNPIKANWIFVNTMQDNTFHFYRFIKRPYETINVVIDIDHNFNNI
jgi:hypothetical protein